MPHLCITIGYHSQMTHMYKTPFHCTCSSHLAIISGYHICESHLIITSSHYILHKTPSYLFHMYLYYLSLDCHGSQVSRNSGPSLCKSSMWCPPVLPCYAWCPSKGSTLSPGPNTSLLFSPILLICGLLSSCSLTLFPSNTLFSIPLGDFFFHLRVSVLKAPDWAEVKFVSGTKWQHKAWREGWGGGWAKDRRGEGGLKIAFPTACRNNCWADHISAGRKEAK